METKTVRKYLGGGKKKSKRRTGRSRSNSRKSRSKNSRSRKDIFDKKLSVNNSQFWCGAFTKSSLRMFDKVPVLETIMSSQTQEVFPSTSLDESSVHFKFDSDRNLYLDMRDTHLSLKQLQLFMGR